MSPTEYCQQKAAASGSSFYYSFLFLPPPQRAAITALYAYCREVDDVVDETTDRALARIKIAWWREEIGRVYAGDPPQHPVTRALQPAARSFALPQELLETIIDGMAMDLDHDRYPDFSALRSYCYRVAGVVGLLAARIFGYRNDKTLAYAEQLGIAFQLTNIIRDVLEDARRGRLYLPQDELGQFGVDPTDILSGRTTPNFTRLMQFQVERAREFYSAALASLPAEDRRSQRAGLIMAAIYRTLLEEIEADGCRVLQHRVSLTPLRKLWLAWKTWLFA